MLVDIILFARIGKSGGYRIDHHYPNDHDPTHVHISEGDRPMTQGEKKAFKRLLRKIIETLKPWN